MDAASLRPLGVGEILDAGIKIYRRRFGTLVRAVAVVVVPVSVLSGVIGLSAASDTSGDFNGSDAALIGAAVISGILGLIAGQLATAASFEIVSGDYLDHAPTWQASLRAAWGRLGSLLWVTFLWGLCLAVGALGCLIPAIYLYAMFSVTVPVLLFEGVRGRKALGRSRDLIQGRGWPTLAVLVVTIILVSIVRVAIQGVLLGVLVAGNDVVDALASTVATAASSVLVTPFSAAVVSVLYFDARVRKEGFDLELLANQIGVDPPAGTTERFVPDDVPEQPPFWPPPPGWNAGGSPPEG